MMKAETKAKRRATLDLLGLGILDETEIPPNPLKGEEDVLNWELLHEHNTVPVSYTHLDVYKRQLLHCCTNV